MVRARAISSPRNHTMTIIAELTDDHRDAFERDGYVVLRQGLGRDDVDKLRTWTQEVVDWPEVSGRHWIFRDPSLLEPDKRILTRIERIAPFHPGFRALSDALGGAVARLLGAPAVLFKEKINFKPPGGGGFEAHQDAQAGWDRYAPYFVSALVAIDPADQENGCLQVAPASHRQGVHRLWEPLGEAEVADMTFIPCETQPGDLVFFDSYVAHASQPNLSQRMRRLYYATYNRRSDGDQMDRYYADKHANYPPDIDRDPDKSYVFKV